ncbi:hypothetical protein KY285_008029 [Solanum tuberosum]|nr:hypothetical protein KY285_008029 [Solanum tuberosum]
MPNLSTIFFSSTLANMSLLGARNFIGEFLILVGAFQRNSLVATLATLEMILDTTCSLWLHNRAVSGNLKPDFLHKFSDPNGKEVSIFIPFLVGGATGETDRKKRRGATMHGTSRPCLQGTVELATHECCRVGRANNSKAFEHGELYHQYGDWNGNQKSDWVLVVQDNQTINNSNISMQLFGSTGEPEGRDNGIWEGGLVQWEGPSREKSQDNECSARQAGGRSSGQVLGLKFWTPIFLFFDFNLGHQIVVAFEKFISLELELLIPNKTSLDQLLKPFEFIIKLLGLGSCYGLPWSF